MHGQSMLEHMKRQGQISGPTRDNWGLVKKVEDARRLSALYDTPTDHMKLLESLKAQSQPASPAFKSVSGRRMFLPCQLDCASTTIHFALTACHSLCPYSLQLADRRCALRSQTAPGDLLKDLPRLNVPARVDPTGASPLYLAQALSIGDEEPLALDLGASYLA